MSSYNTKIMGILNITPDSFSDGGKFIELDNALSHMQEMIDQGADIIDIGGESTRPNSIRIPWEEEFSRIKPLLSAIKGSHIPISIDTMNSRTALASLDYGVEYINDVSGGIYDDQMYKVIADNNVNYICQHWRVNMDSIEAEKYWNLLHDVMHELYVRIKNMREIGIKDEKIIIDPGLGFYKTHEQSWELLNKVDRLKELGFPILIGASRKRMTVLYDKVSISDRDKVTAKISAFCEDHNIWGVRVHNVALTKKYLEGRAVK
jgi:hypothetical protein